MRLVSLLLLTSISAGCGSKWTALDADGDGVTVLDGDCSEAAAGGDQIGPNAAEIWYDGVDQNCDGGDDFDKDGDGFKSAAFGGDDCWDDPDLRPDEYESLNGFADLDAAAIFPGADDVYYDGVDSDCGGDDDFDADGDGYATANPDYPGRDGSLGDDCYDDATDDYPASGELVGDAMAPDEVNPGATDEWYDGTDQNCDGESDYDQDGDGYNLDSECDDTDPAVTPNPDIEEIWYNDVDENCDGNKYDKDLDGFDSAEYGGDDCWDDYDSIPDGYDAINGFDQPAADAVHPDDGSDSDFVDTPYDGVDADCGGDDDFDWDADGYATDEFADRDGVTGDDCDDDEGTTYPGADDEWYDGIDADCAGNSDYDADGDDFDSETWLSTGTDCDDDRSNVNPDQTEVCGTSYDDDCDGETDAEDAIGCIEWYSDRDGDGHGTTVSQCWCDAQTADDYDSLLSDDCDDGDAAINPDEDEICDSRNTDEDCDGAADNNDATALSSGKTTYYHDDDDDGYGDEDHAGSAYCDNPTTSSQTWVLDNTDCNDASDVINPGEQEVCDSSNVDEDCDGLSDNSDTSAASSGKTTYYPDDDGDEYGDDASSGTLYCDDPSTSSIEWSLNHTDCDDTDLAINPAATEICDPSNTDEDCDGAADNNDSTAASSGKTRYYEDDDGDEYGDETSSGTLYCDDPSTSSVEWSTNHTDCDDTSASINDGMTEICDAANTDEDCDGNADNNDTSAASSGKTRYYPDDDGDEYGDENSSGTLYCDDPSTSSVEWSTDNTDCDDSNDAVSPADTEICDSANTDEDCDGVADNNDTSASSTGKTRYYEDDDGDEYGDETSSGTLYCDDPSTSSVEWSTTHTDCNDASASINPAATEVCDSSNTDEDCDDLADDNDTSTSSTGKTRYYEDDDGDEYGDETSSGTLYCDDPSTVSVEWSTDHTDCNDASASINTAATEVCDSSNTDEDCDDLADNNDTSASSTGKTRYYEDDDGDEYGDETSTGTLYCDDPSTVSVEWSTNHTDCNDASAAINDAATEVCDSGDTDEDCDGLSDDDDSSVSSTGKTRYYEDDDGDEYGDETSSGTLYCDDPSTSTVEWSTNHTDCDDTDAAINDLAAELCDPANADEDCDGLADDNDTSASNTGKTRYYPDDDGDEFGDDASAGALYCDDPSTVSVELSTDNTDCDDADALVNPGAADPTDGLGTDNDCDGFIDDDDIGEGSVTINEFFVHGNAELEWFEIVNTAGVDLTLDGWTFSVCYDSTTNESAGYICDSAANTGEIVDTFTLPAGTTLADGEYAILCADETSFLTETCLYDYTYADITAAGGLGYNNGGATLEMGTTLVDQIDWWTTSGGDDWPSDANYSTQFSLDLLTTTPAVLNDDWSSDGTTDDQWCLYSGLTEWGTGYFGTPGDVNEDCTP